MFVPAANSVIIIIIIYSTGIESVGIRNVGLVK